MDIKVFPETHPYHKVIVFDTREHQYYNRRTDIYLSDDDVKYYNLLLPDRIPKPVPIKFKFTVL